MSKGQCLLWYMTAKAASRRHCFTWIHHWKLHHPLTPPSPSFTSQHAAASHSALSLFFLPQASCEVLWLMGIRWYAPPQWLPFQQAKPQLINCLVFSLFFLFFGCRVLQWIKTCSFSARQPAAPLIDSVWLLCAVNLICLVVKKKRKAMKKSWFNEGVSGIDKPTWRQTSFGGRAEREMCCLLSVM